MGDLTETIALVAGATRGAGRGIAVALGEAGATVYCTGRSVRGEPSPYERPETIDETAELVSSAGGTGIPVRVDHTIESDVKQLLARISRTHGRLDVLASSIAGEDPGMSGWTSLWDTALDDGDGVLRRALLSRIITAKYAARLMKKQKRGLIVEVTEGDLAPGGGGGNVLNDVVKASIKTLAFHCAAELREHGVAAVAITPGFLRSESMLDHFGVTEDTWRDAGKQDKNFLESESPRFVGRAVAALAGDPDVMRWSGQLTSSWDVARVYGFTDYDGRRPDWGTHFRDRVIPSMDWLRDGYERQLALLERLSDRVRWYLSKEANA